MRSVGIKALKDRLSHYVRLAGEGERVLITDRDEVVAELGPLSPSRSPVLQDAVLADLVRRGVLTPALYGPEAGPPPRGEPIAPLSELLEGLDADRADRT